MPGHLALAALIATLVVGPLQAAPTLWAQDRPNTDFRRHTIDLSEILSGGPPKDGIPALDQPGFLPAAEETGIGDREPVPTLALGNEARAHPMRHLMCTRSRMTRVPACPWR